MGILFLNKIEQIFSICSILFNRTMSSKYNTTKKYSFHLTIFLFSLDYNNQSIILEIILSKEPSDCVKNNSGNYLPPLILSIYFNIGNNHIGNKVTYELSSILTLYFAQKTTFHTTVRSLYHWFHLCTQNIFNKLKNEILLDFQAGIMKLRTISCFKRLLFTQSAVTLFHCLNN